MDIRVVRKYIASNRMDKDILCPYDGYDTLPNLDDNDTIFLYCLACDYKVSIGYNLYDKMKRAVDAENRGPR